MYRQDGRRTTFDPPLPEAARIVIRESAAALDRSASDKVIFALFTADVYDAFALALQSVIKGPRA